MRLYIKPYVYSSKARVTDYYNQSRKYINYDLCFKYPNPDEIIKTARIPESSVCPNRFCRVIFVQQMASYHNKVCFKNKRDWGIEVVVNRVYSYHISISRAVEDIKIKEMIYKLGMEWGDSH